MNFLQYEIIYLKTDLDFKAFSDPAVKKLAAGGHPASRIIKALTDALRGEDVKIWQAVFDATDLAEDTCFETVIFNQVAYYFTGIKEFFDEPLSIDDFILCIAWCFRSGAHGFPQNETFADRLLAEV